MNNTECFSLILIRTKWNTIELLLLDHLVRSGVWWRVTGLICPLIRSGDPCSSTWPSPETQTAGIPSAHLPPLPLPVSVASPAPDEQQTTQVIKLKRSKAFSDTVLICTKASRGLLSPRAVQIRQTSAHYKKTDLTPYFCLVFHITFLIILKSGCVYLRNKMTQD